MPEFLTRKVGPLPVWAWIAIGGAVLYVYRRSQASSSSSSNSSQALAAQLAAAQAGQTVPTESLTTSGGTYSGPAGQAPPSITNPGPSTPGGGGGTGTPTPGGGSSGPGYGTTSVGGMSYVNLGTITGAGGAYSGYNVGGGAPVYYLTPGSSTPQVDLTPQAVAALPGGTQVLTPAGYGGAVGSAPTTEKIGG